MRAALRTPFSKCVLYFFSQDVLYTICNNCGPVQRIVIFRKNGVQAMVEYPFRWVQNLGAICDYYVFDL